MQDLPWRQIYMKNIHFRVSVHHALSHLFICLCPFPILIHDLFFFGSTTCQQRRLRTDCTFSAWDAGWTLIAFEQRIQPSVWTRCSPSKWANKESSFLPFFLRQHYCRRHDNRIRLSFSIAFDQKKMRVNEKRPISLSSLFNVLLPST